ncbi:hypothetical protein [Cohnella sp. GbtcB17]|uniref:hypothetical protein n=1 Tax=Cohnella sp. GbtcB17 TaxID=2824762 RepID=UPI001C2F9C58|nr:hypothetical protein [Cohnella sp. GbtcB17]
MAELNADHPQNIRVTRWERFRYAWVGALALLSVVALGVYYGYASDERLPSFHLETVEGDSSIGSEIRLDGSYGGRKGNRSMQVDAEGTRYTDANRVGRLFILPFSKTYTASTEALIKAHREFMRGKEYGTFEQNEDKLIYAELVHKEGRAILKLSVLNKKTEKSENYSWQAGSWKQREQVYIADMQIEGELAHLLIIRSTATLSNESIAPQLFDYVFELSAGKLVDTREIRLPVQAGYDVSVANRGTNADSVHAVIFTSRVKGTSTAAGGASSQPAASTEAPIIEYKPFIYNYRDGSVKSLDLAIPDNMTHTNYYVDGDKLYGVTVDGNPVSWRGESFNIVETDLLTQAQTAAYTLNASDYGGEEILAPRFKDGKFYFIVSGAQAKESIGRASTKVVVVEAGTGKAVYEGQVAYEGPSNEAASELSQTVLLNLELRS